tara:strand:- start:697 stop:1773 length:1077 start_codon:yes stop_codon:yes gene_type:complete
MKKTIIFIIGHLSHGGAEKQLYLLIKGLDKYGFLPLVICLSETNHPWGDRITRLGIKVIYISRFFRYDLSRVFRLAWHINHHNPHIIVSSLHIANVYYWLSSKLFLFKKPPYIAQIRSKASSMKGIEKWLNIKGFNSANMIVTNSKLLIPFTVKHFKQDRNKIIAINNGIEIKKIDRNYNKIFNIGIIAKDSKEKNIDLFIDLALELLNRKNNLNFHLCGRGLKMPSRFLNKIPEELLKFFIFHGEVNNPENIYELLDLYVSSSISEGSPNVIIESLSYGIPVVATNVGGVSELVSHGENGFLVESGDLGSLIKYCELLIGDFDLREKMGKNSRDFINKNYSYEKMVSEFSTIIQSLL